MSQNDQGILTSAVDKTRKLALEAADKIMETCQSVVSSSQKNGADTFEAVEDENNKKQPNEHLLWIGEPNESAPVQEQNGEKIRAAGLPIDSF
ncbi:unnamed protein product [Caenorhabditis auriculariae]|uniref:Uncharacterized protein n=1 Tax=Caenorhabditis auriculariae TaxID=2777116 RepID=A0A8S1HSZ8_9PELO|nr:unnamed protein product [Caenorhabditis auriculariae]